MKLPDHIPSLDGMRGIAILLVILTHCGGGWHAALSIVRDTSDIPDLALPKLLSKLTVEAAHGVQMFFVVSAFTLTLRSIERNDNILAYFARRIARIGPAYWLAGIFYLIVAGSSARLYAPAGVGGTDIALTGGFLSAWQGGPALAVVPGGWSVSCEASFYVILPLLIYVFARRLSLYFVLLFFAIVVALLNLNSSSGSDEQVFSTYINPVQQMPVFIMGIIAALIVVKFNIRRIPFLPALSLIAALIVPPAIFYLFHSVPTYLVFSALVACTVVWASLFQPSFLTNRIIVRVGTVSYSMYLVHFAILPISMTVNSWITSSGIVHLFLHFMMTTTITFLISNVTYEIVERPPMRWVAKTIKRFGFGLTKQIVVPSQK